MTCSVITDYDTSAGGDKFGNIFITRLPADISEEVDDDPTGNKLAYERGYLQGAPHRVCFLNVIFSFFVINSLPLAPAHSRIPCWRAHIFYSQS